VPHGFGLAGVSNYGWNMGDWFVWGGFSGPPNRAPFQVNRARRWADFTDGTSATILAAEVKTNQAYLRDCGGLARVNQPANVPAPNADPAAVAPEYNAGCSLQATGHTEWVDGHVHQTGFTTAWTPNRRTPRASNPAQDLDLNGQREAIGGPTYAAITARSYHPGGVNVLLGDGSVRFVKDSLAGASWRALGSPDGGEVVSGDAF
jgi:prepilin-type processing-associated H-X9-DG protein